MALSASYTSTIGEELVQLVRLLQRNDEWTTTINATISRHLINVTHYMTVGMGDVTGGAGGDAAADKDVVSTQASTKSAVVLTFVLS